MLEILGQYFTEIRFWLKPPESFDIVFFFVLRMFLQLPIWELLAVVINQGQKFANLWKIEFSSWLLTNSILLSVQEAIIMSVVGDVDFNDMPDLIVTEDVTGVNAGKFPELCDFVVP